MKKKKKKREKNTNTKMTHKFSSKSNPHLLSEFCAIIIIVRASIDVVPRTTVRPVVFTHSFAFVIHGRETIHRLPYALKTIFDGVDEMRHVP